MAICMECTNPEVIEQWPLHFPPIMFSPTEELLAFTCCSLLILNFLWRARNCLINLQLLLYLSVIIHNTKNKQILEDSLVKQCRTCFFRNSKGLEQEMKANSTLKPWLPFIERMPEVQKPSSQRLGRTFLICSLSATFSFCFFLSIKQACLFSESKMRRWQLTEKQQFALIKVFFENEFFYFSRFEF